MTFSEIQSNHHKLIQKHKLALEAVISFVFVYLEQ